MGYKLNEPIMLSVLAAKLKYEWKGVDIKIESVSSSDTAVESDLTFSKQPVQDTAGVAVIAAISDSSPIFEFSGVLVSENPRLTFIKALNFLVSEIGFSTWNSPSVIHPSAKIGQNVVIEDGCYIGANTIIEHNVVLHAGTRIGENSRIRSCSSIGGDGFGFERLQDGMPLRFPHIGGVVIGNNVEIGSCTAVARGTLSDTVIEDNVKIDNLVHIAHNCLVKNGAFVIACAEISGGVEVGRNSWIAPNSCTHQKIVIGEEAIVGLGAVVTKDVPSKSVYAGNPAKKIRDIS
ncbi:UDP-3-O-(3-hydroxymyristoyl)glucosamine N-acyltransferase [Thalassolituus oleivorans]|uniref:UDP-3-O-(3-hydroxymyristoyl)glucosamine N-acyltransferase n=1 Tax=Thalassolituus oleivorans TaxID=187493 RepID=UPI0023F04985|nr:UDP-3-O-(3-hydroxymyristoyl)glucosamine N-acyltransferase [Thalassolituus oleivorans]